MPYMDLLLEAQRTQAGTLRVRHTLYDKLVDVRFTGLHISRYVPDATNVDPMYTPPTSSPAS